jgi:CarD family transcriptional regulator
MLDHWKIGDKAVYPSHGVGQIKAVEANDLFGSGAQVYVLELLDTSRRILIPVQKADQVGLRKVVSGEAAEGVLAVLKEPPPPTKPMPWTKRQRALVEKLSSGSLFDVAEVLRELYHLKGVKDLSFGQRRLFDTATSLLVQELAVALERSSESMEQEIREIFA